MSPTARLPKLGSVIFSIRAIGCLLSTPDTQILDVGSGAGFPGLVLAIMGGVTVDLVESDQRKAVFLSTVIRELGLPAKVHNQRIETMPNLRPDVITARALALFLSY